VGESMRSTKREHSLSVWAFVAGYCLFYVPYCGLTKAVTSGHPGGGRQLSGFELLPSTVLVTSILMLTFVSVMGWWAHAGKRTLSGIVVPFPRLETVISGVAFAIIILTTTLAFTFSGISIVLALLLMRAGVLVLSPLVDVFYQRNVRWFSWVGLVLSMSALAVAFTSVHNPNIGAAAALNLGAYLTGYSARIPCMTRAAKTRDLHTLWAYFAEEQLVAMPTLVLLPAVLALVGKGGAFQDLRLGFMDILHASRFAVTGYLIGLCYAGLGIFGTLIYLDRRENTFCIPMNRCSSLLSGFAATYWLAAAFPTRAVTISEVIATSLVVTALLVMSPLHHLPLYIRQVKDAIRDRQLAVFRFVPADAGEAGDPKSAITVDLHAVRRVLQKRR
jgi:hypothetical protein